jgi:hypothetical protein
MGPIGRIINWFNKPYFTCVKTNLSYFTCSVQTANGPIGQGVFCPEMGDIFQVNAVAIDGSSDDPQAQPIYTYPLPGGHQYPPGWPDKPYLPGQDGNAPVYDRDPNKPTPIFQIPFKIPPVPLPIVVPLKPTLSVPINAPISIPVSITPTANVDVSPQITFSLNQDGSLTTYPDTPCPCDESPSLPPTQTVELPFLFVDSGSCKSVTRYLSVLPNSIPSDFAELAFDTQRLALKSCERSSLPVLAVPEWWPTRVGQRPQTSFVFTYETSNSFNYSSLVVPFPLETEKPTGEWISPFSYTSGSVMGMIKFEDGGRLQVYCITTAEADRVLDWLLSQMVPALAGGIEERYVKENARDLPARPKHLVKAFYFPTGRKSLTPAWEWNRP